MPKSISRTPFRQMYLDTMEAICYKGPIEFEEWRTLGENEQMGYLYVQFFAQIELAYYKVKNDRSIADNCLSMFLEELYRRSVKNGDIANSGGKKFKPGYIYRIAFNSMYCSAVETKMQRSIYVESNISESMFIEGKPQKRDRKVRVESEWMGDNIGGDVQEVSKIAAVPDACNIEENYETAPYVATIQQVLMELSNNTLGQTYKSFGKTRDLEEDTFNMLSHIMQGTEDNMTATERNLMAEVLPKLRDIFTSRGITTSKVLA